MKKVFQLIFGDARNIASVAAEALSNHGTDHGHGHGHGHDDDQGHGHGHAHL